MACPRRCRRQCRRMCSIHGVLILVSGPCYISISNSYAEFAPAPLGTYQECHCLEWTVQDLFRPWRYHEGIAGPGGPMDLDLRKLRYFVAVADRLHFGRAADELHIAQPVLSRQIRALEQDLGTPLLIRDSHGVVLTEAGRQLLTDAGPLLASAHAVRRRVTAAARGSQRLMVGYRAGIPVTPAVRQFAERHPDILVDVQRIEWDDQAPMLLDGRIDIGYVRPPIHEARLRVTPLLTESRGGGLPA